ncbi:MAG: hypothetical protein OHK0050_38010 [Roseiflexaceae bacterium]
MPSLAELIAIPDGELARIDAGGLRLVVIKRGGQIGLFFANPNGSYDGPMSRMDPMRPWHLASEYTQALLLALLWNPQPARVGMLGFGGGRIATVLHHHLPTCTIESVDIDHQFIPIATEWFGFEPTPQQIIHIGDGRTILEQTSQHFDLIIMDAFGDQNAHLLHMATVEFYSLCKQKLTQGGVLAINLLRADPFFAAKLAGVFKQFRFVVGCGLKHSLVLFARAQASDLRRLPKRASELERRMQFDFPFAERAAMLQPVRAADFGLSQQEPLTDARIGSLRL